MGGTPVVVVTAVCATKFDNMPRPWRLPISPNTSTKSDHIKCEVQSIDQILLFFRRPTQMGMSSPWLLLANRCLKVDPGSVISYITHGKGRPYYHTHSAHPLSASFSTGACFLPATQHQHTEIGIFVDRGGRGFCQLCGGGHGELFRGFSVRSRRLQHP